MCNTMKTPLGYNVPKSILFILAVMPMLLVAILYWGTMLPSHQDNCAYTLGEELRIDAEAWHKKWREGAIIHKSVVPFCGNSIEVDIVEDVRDAEYGFCDSPSILNNDVFVAHRISYWSIQVVELNGEECVFVILSKPFSLSCRSK